MFEITIKEKRTVKKVVGNVWAVIGEKEEILEINEEREVLKQTVDELDLAAVIKAINKL